MNDILKRKKRHLQVTQNGDMDYFDQYKLRYNALPEVDFEQIDCRRSFWIINWLFLFW